MHTPTGVEPGELTDLAERCIRRVLKAEWVAAGAYYYCVALECGHHIHMGTEFLRAEVMCAECLRGKLNGGGGYDGQPAHGPCPNTAAYRSRFDVVYEWQPGMPYRWWVTTARVAHPVRHIIGKQLRNGAVFGLCRDAPTGREVPTDEGQPCERCLARAEYLNTRIGG